MLVGGEDLPLRSDPGPWRRAAADAVAVSSGLISLRCGSANTGGSRWYSVRAVEALRLFLGKTNCMFFYHSYKIISVIFLEKQKHSDN